MADISQTAANVTVAGTGGSITIVQAGEAITQGMPVYLSSGKYFKTDANGTVLTAAVVGIAMTPAALDGYFILAGNGTKIDLGATLVIGTPLVVSATAGGIAPIADLATGWWVSHLGTPSAAGLVTLKLDATGVAVP